MVSVLPVINMRLKVNSLGDKVIWIVREKSKLRR
jgi:hypothetical protein